MEFYVKYRRIAHFPLGISELSEIIYSANKRVAYLFQKIHTDFSNKEFHQTPLSSIHFIEVLIYPLNISTGKGLFFSSEKM